MAFSFFGSTPINERLNLYKAAFDYGPVPMAFFDYDGYFRVANQKFAELLEIPAKELNSGKVNFADVTHEDDVAIDIMHYKSLQAGEIDSYSMRKRYYTRSKRVVWINLFVTKVTDSLSEVVVVHAVDITEILKAKEELRARNQELQEKTSRLATVNNQLRALLTRVSKEKVEGLLEATHEG